MYNIRLLDQNRRRVAVIEAPVSWQYTRRPSEATDVTLTVPRERVEAGLPPGVDLYVFLAPYQVAHVGVSPGTTPHKPKHRRGDIGHYVEIYRGTQHIVTGRILKVDITDETIAFQCLTEEIELEKHVTPAQYGRKWDHWDLADVARDLLHGWHTLRVKDQSQWEEAIEAVNVDTTTEPGVVMLAKSSGRYVSSGHITVRFKRDDVPNFVRWDRIRWASDNAAPVRTTMQYRYDGGAWSDEVEGALPDEIGVVPGTTNAEVIDVRINLYTDDRDTEDDEGNPVGQTPFVFAVELIARTTEALMAGDIPAVAGVKVSGLEADGVSAFNVLSQACAQTGWEFWVSDGRLFLASEMGQDRTSSVLLRAGTNISVQTLSTSDDELVNILTAYGPGSGINRLVTVRRHEESIVQYGPHPGKYEFPEVATLDDLIQAADEYLEKHAAPIPAYQVEVHYPYGTEPDFGCGDYVRVVDPRNGIVASSRIAEEQREYSVSGLRTTLFLGVPAPSLARQVRPTPPPREVTPPAKPEISVSPIAGGIRVVDTRAPKTKWLTTECHVSDEPDFERTSETLVENARKSRFDVSGLTPGTRYYAQLVRIDPNGNEAVSDVRSAVAGDIPEPTPDLTPPPAPTGLAVMTGLRKHVLVWDRHQGPPPLDRYEVQYATRPDGGAWSDWLVASAEVRSGIYSHEGLDLALEYRYRMRAVSRAGVASDWSAVVEAGLPGKVSLSEEVVDRLARERLSQDVQAELDGYAQGLEDAADRLDDVESTLVQHAQDITARVTQTVFDTLEGRVEDVEGELTILAGEVAARVTQTVFDTLAGRVTAAEGTLTVHATQIAARVTQTVFDALEGRVDVTESDITQLAGEITAAVSRIADTETFIAAFALTPEEVSSTVAKLMPGGELYTTIQQTAEDVAQRVVKKGEVVAEINASEEGVRIAGGKIQLDGNTDVLGDFKVSGDVMVEGSFKPKGLGFLSLGHKASDEIGLKFWGVDDTGEYIFRAPESLGEFPDIYVSTNSTEVYDEMEFDFFVPKGCIAMNFAVGYYGGGGADMVDGTFGWARILVENEERFYSTWSWYWDDNAGQFMGIQPSDATMLLDIPPEWGGTWKTMKFEVSASATPGNSASTGLRIRSVSVQFKLRMMGYESDFGLDAEEEEEPEE